MKKDKEWLKKEIEEYLVYEGVRDARIALESVLGYIDQLDEPEVLSEEWVKCHEQQVHPDHPSNEWWVPSDDLRNLLVPKQDKPVIPQFVADWIESYRKKTLVELINDAVYSSDEDSKCFRRWFHEEMGFESNYSEFLSRAWLDGYEVEREQKYYVLDKEDATLLKKSAAGGGVAKSVGTNIYNVKSWKDEEKYQLTEQEIKEYDERYMNFAVKIEELE